MSSTKSWLRRPIDKELFHEFVTQGFFTPLFAQIFVSRGFKTIKEAYSFLFPQLTDFCDPFLLPDMDLAVKRIFKALKNKEKIGIYGDSDADGMIGTFILYDFLQTLGAKVEYLIPDRDKEGYGFHGKFLPYFKERGISLIITVDVGVSAYETINQAKALGIEVIVTDHHEIINKPETIVISGKLLSSSPLYHLCGAGVAFTLIRALRSYLYVNGFFKNLQVPQIRKYMELVTLATLADMVPLTGENRIITFFGFRDLLSSAFTAIRLLVESSKSNGALSEEDLCYYIIPKINAAGRMGSPDLIVRLLEEREEQSVRVLLKELEELNSKRQILESELIAKIETKLKSKPLTEPFIFIVEENLPKGLMGLLANRLKNSYNLPVIIVSVENGVGVASCRCPENIDFLKIISRCEDLLLQYGGHKHALGFRISVDLIDKFKQRLLLMFKETDVFLISEKETLHIEAEAELSELLHPENFKALSYLHPYGEGHPPPTLLLKNFEVKERSLLKEKHSRLLLKRGIHEIQAVYFNNLIPEDQWITLILGQPFINSFKNRMEIKILDVR